MRSAVPPAASGCVGFAGAGRKEPENSPEVAAPAPRGMWADAVARLGRGEVVVVDDVLGGAAAAGALADVKALLRAGRLRGDNVSAAIGPAIYRAVPRLWDSYRLIAWMKTDEIESSAAHLAAASHGLNAIVAALGIAERALRSPLNPAWPPLGVAPDPHGSLLAVGGFNGTRYAIHTDAGARKQRKLTAIWYPLTEPGWTDGAGGELVVRRPRATTTAGRAGGERAVRVAPRTDRLVLFHSELVHEVLPCAHPRISFTSWAHGVGARVRPPPQHLDMGPACTSDMCRAAGRTAE